MKKYFVSIIFGLIIGFFLSKTLLDEYKGYKEIKTVSSTGINAYFIKYGSFNTLDELEKKTISLTNYIFLEQNNKFDVYIGITTKEEIKDKLIEYFKSLGYKVSYEEFIITNTDYIEYLNNADKLLENTNDVSVLGEVCSQILSKYEELVINGSKDERITS